ncbi:hypothetical protein B0H34DRAFT_729165 [Crassisporium funariophilum]|nr:hypothetical protein B0H34DRAFT_729165 [Crassisporium funariophilum]
MTDPLCFYASRPLFQYPWQFLKGCVCALGGLLAVNPPLSYQSSRRFLAQPHPCFHVNCGGEKNFLGLFYSPSGSTDNSTSIIYTLPIHRMNHPKCRHAPLSHSFYSGSPSTSSGVQHHNTLRCSAQTSSLHRSPRSSANPPCSCLPYVSTQRLSLALHSE